MGWEIAEGPELEHEWFNFDALNFDADHPARADAGHVLRRPGRARTSCCARTRARCRCARCSSASCRSTSLCPGRVYRTDEFDATHLPVFTSSRASPSTRASRWRTSRARSTTLARALFGAEAQDAPPRQLLPVHRAERRARPLAPDLQGRRRAGSSGAAAAWSTRTCCARRASTPRTYSGFAFGMGIERDADVPQRRAGHARHGRGRCALQRSSSGWWSDARPAVAGCASTSTSRRSRRPRTCSPRSCASGSKRRTSTASSCTGPIVVGEVLEFVEEPQSNGKTIRWCQVRRRARRRDGADGGPPCTASSAAPATSSPATRSS